MFMIIFNVVYYNNVYGVFVYYVILMCVQYIKNNKKNIFYRSDVRRKKTQHVVNIFIST